MGVCFNQANNTVFIEMSNFIKHFQLSDPFKISFVISLILLSLCISPDLPTIGLYLNGGLLSVVDRLLLDKKNTVSSNIFLLNYIVNLGLAILFFVVFSVTNKRWVKVVFSALSVIFFYYFLLFLLADKLESWSESFIFFILALLSCLWLNIAVILKYTFSKKP
jgi:hypothetical protein